MKICKICGEEYQEEHRQCDFCGCPEEWIEAQHWELPEELRERYELVRVFEIGENFPDGLYWSAEIENVVCIYKLPATEAGRNCCGFIKQLTGDEKWYPHIYKVVPPEENSCGYYICEYRIGEKLLELTGRANPPGAELSAWITEEIQELLQKTEEKGGNTGIFDLSHLQITEKKLVLTNPGPGDYSVSDREQAERLIRRIQRGWWDSKETETIRKSGFWRKIFNR